MSDNISPLVQRYLDDHGSLVEPAVAAFAADLMRGDPASFKAGYTRPNAVLATAEMFGLSREHVEDIVPR